MRYSIFILFSFLLLSLTSCRTDFDTIPSSGKLEFSDETVYLDTIFSQISSSTYQLKVYNRSNDDIKIPTIRLEKPDSKYRLMVDGRSDNNGKRFDNVELLAKDSLFIFIETTVVNAVGQLEFTYEDKILFDEGTNQQNVKLVTLVRDACFIKPNRNLDATLYETILVEGFTDENEDPFNGHTLVGDELIWKKDKPYVIYGNAVVPNGKTLVVEAGAQVYFHDGATLIVDNGAKIDIQGQLNDVNSEGIITNRKEVTFEGDRLEPIYENVPEQWGTVFILSGSASGITNEIDYLTLKNASVGLFLQSNTISNIPKLEIKNSQIYDCSNVGILARYSDVTGINLVMNSAGQACFAGTLGGNYDFTHCTFNNEWPSTTQVAVILNNYLRDKNNVLIDTFNLVSNFKNCIIYGSNNIELLIEKVTTTKPFTTSFQNCLVKFNDSNTQLSGDSLYNQIRNQENGNKKNLDPKFKNPDRNFIWLSENSPADNGGVFLPLYDKDILDKVRSSVNTDIGAYQFVPIP
jgi:hypothetical protein